MLRELSTFLVLFVLIALTEAGAGHRRQHDRSSNGTNTLTGEPCQPVLCRMHCPRGWRIENGCEVCECRERRRGGGEGGRNRPSRSVDAAVPEPECPQIECDSQCPNGYQRDENNCQLCTCKGSCPPICSRYCENGFKQDANGCDICACRSSWSSSYNKTHGHHGGRHHWNKTHHHDHHKEHGTGHWNRTHHDRKNHTSHHGGDHPHHGASKMGHRGEHGGLSRLGHHSAGIHRHQANQHHRPGSRNNGGTEVRCKPKRCPNRCSHGYTRDSFGCRTCGCVQRGQTVAPEVCANRPMCTLFCVNGFKKGSDGCDICDCNP